MLFSNGYVNIGGTDMSQMGVTEVDFAPSFVSLDGAILSVDTDIKVPGLKTYSLRISFLQDFSVGKIDATLFPLLGTFVSWEIRPVNAAASTSNPKYTATTALVQAYTPFARAAVGQLARAEVVIVPGGATPSFNRATS